MKNPISNKNKSIKFNKKYKKINKNGKKAYSVFLDIVKKAKFEEFDDYQYYLDYIIGSGGTMKTFYGRNKITNDDLAIKIDKTKKNKILKMKQ